MSASVVMLGAVSATTPSPLWFATRGAGVVTLVLLTATVVLGIASSLRWEGRHTPRFVTAALHRNLSLLAMALLAVHITTAVLDPFAQIHALDAAIPFTGAYRTVWLGLGVLAAEVMAAVTLTSLARGRIGPRVWRLIHWGAYASWPLAVVHGLGTGTDAQAPWLIGLTVACGAAVLLAIAQRLLAGTWRTLPMRLIAGGVTVAAVVAICAWAERGPLQSGWAAAAGTPTKLLGGSAPTAPVHTGPGGFADNLVGVIVQPQGGGTEIAFRDVIDPGLTLSIMPPGPTQTLPTMTIDRNGKTLCSMPARVVTSFYAVCGSVRVVVDLTGSPAHLTGLLVTSGPLG